MKTKLIIVLVILIALGLFLYQNNMSNPAQQTPSPTTSSINPTPATPTAKKSPTVTSTSAQTNTGTLVFGITDKAAGLDNIGSIELTVEALKIHSPIRGWIDVLQAPMQYDLMQLRNAPRSELISEANLPADNYDQTQMIIGNMYVINKSGGSSALFLPSGNMYFNSNVKVIKGKISSVVVDFLADKSLHSAIDGKLIFFPKMNIETKSETTLQTSPIAGSANKKVEFLGGDTNFSGNIGMDISGILRANGSVDPLADLQIVNGTVQVIPKSSSGY